MKNLDRISKNLGVTRFLYQYAEGLNAGDSIDSQQSKYAELFESTEAEAKVDLKKLSEALQPNVSVEITKEGGYLYGALWQILHKESFDASKSFKEVQNSNDVSLKKQQASVMLALKELTAAGFDVNTFKKGESVIVSADGKLSIGKNKIEINNGEISGTTEVNEDNLDIVKDSTIPTTGTAGQKYMAKAPTNAVEPITWTIDGKVSDQTGKKFSTMPPAGTYKVVVSGKLSDGTPFENTQTVEISEKAEIKNQGYTFENGILKDETGKAFALDHLPHDEIAAIYASMTAAEKAAAFKEGLGNFEKINEQQRLQFEQFELTNQMMSAMESYVLDSGDAKKDYGWLSKMAQGANNILFAETIQNLTLATKKYNSEKENIKNKIMAGESFSDIFNELLPPNSESKKAINTVFGESWYSVDITAGRLSSFDISNIENKSDLLKFKALIVKKLRDTETTGGHYETARNLAMDELSKDFNRIEKNNFSTVMVEGLNGKFIEVQKDVYEEAKEKVLQSCDRKNLIGDITLQLKEQGIDSGDAVERADGYLNGLIMETYKRNRGEKIAEYMNDNDLDKNISADKQVFWEQYKDSAGIGNFDLADESWDTILEELAINAPLIIISGGAANLARAGVSAGARAVAGRMGLNAARMAKLGKWGNRVRQVGRLGGLGIEAAAFEATHGVMMKGMGAAFNKEVHTIFDAENWEDAGSRIAWTAATLGLFKAVHKAGVDKKLAGLVSKISDKKLISGISKVVGLSGGLTAEASVMVLLAAVQNDGFDGDPAEIWKTLSSGDEWFHAFVAAGSLRIGSAAMKGPMEKMNGWGEKQVGKTKNKENKEDSKSNDVKDDSVQSKKADTNKKTAETKSEAQKAQEVADDLSTLINDAAGSEKISLNQPGKKQALERMLTQHEADSRISGEQKNNLLSKAKTENLFNMRDYIKNELKGLDAKEKSVLEGKNSANGKIILDIQSEIKADKSKKSTKEKDGGVDNVDASNTVRKSTVVDTAIAAESFGKTRGKMKLAAQSTKKIIETNFPEKFKKMRSGKSLKTSKLWSEVSLETAREKIKAEITKWENFKITEIKSNLTGDKLAKANSKKNIRNTNIEKIQTELKKKLTEVENELVDRAVNKGDLRAAELVATHELVSTVPTKIDWQSVRKSSAKLEKGSTYKDGIAREQLNVGDKIKVHDNYEIKVLETSEVGTKIEIKDLKSSEIVGEQVLTENLSSATELRFETTNGDGVKRMKVVNLKEKLTVTETGKVLDNYDHEVSKLDDGAAKNTTNPTKTTATAAELKAQKMAAEKAAADAPLESSSEYQEIMARAADAKIAKQDHLKQRKKITNLKKVVAQKKVAIKKLEASEKKSAKELKQKNEQIGQLKSDITSLELEVAKIEGLKQKVVDANSKIANQQSMIEKITNEKNILNDNLTKAQHDLIKTGDQLSDAISKQQLLQKNVADIQAELNDVKIRDAGNTAKIEGLEGRLSDAKEQLQNKSIDIQPFIDAKNAANKKAQKAQKSVQKKQNELDIANSGNKYLATELKVTRKKLDKSKKSRKELKIAKSKIEDLKSIQQKLKENHKAAKKELQQEITELKKQQGEVKTFEILENVSAARFNVEVAELKMNKTFICKNLGVEIAVTKTESGMTLKRDGKIIKGPNGKTEFAKIFVLKDGFKQQVNTLSGESFVIKGKDTLSFEKISKKTKSTVSADSRSAQSYEKRTVEKKNADGSEFKVTEEKGVKVDAKKGQKDQDSSSRIG